MRKIRNLAVLSLLLAGVAFGWIYRQPLVDFYHHHLSRTEAPSRPRFKPDPERYQELIAKINQGRENLAVRYSGARSAEEISQVITDAQQFLEEMLPEMMRCWLGTPWAFSGTCQTPGSGKIACGYFVSTIMRDAGFKVERIPLAQQASQRIIRTFVDRQRMHIRTNLNYAGFLDEVIARGPGIRIVGLDKHVAFLVVTQVGEVRFIHASGADPYCVVDESREQAGSLKRSRYRVTANLTRNPEVIHGWLTGATWPTYGR